jgi:hypothetical protein
MSQAPYLATVCLNIAAMICSARATRRHPHSPLYSLTHYLPRSPCRIAAAMAVEQSSHHHRYSLASGPPLLRLAISSSSQVRTAPPQLLPRVPPSSLWPHRGSRCRLSSQPHLLRLLQGKPRPPIDARGPMAPPLPLHRRQRAFLGQIRWAPMHPLLQNHDRDLVLKFE